jgi:hypothetical protein
MTNRGQKHRTERNDESKRAVDETRKEKAAVKRDDENTSAAVASRDRG